MNIASAVIGDLERVYALVQETIGAVYPNYYPAGAVDFFRAHHSRDAISADLAAGIVYVLEEDGELCGTVTVRDNEIARLFVRPDRQGRGYGRQLMDFAERRVAETFDEIVLDASLPAKAMYLRRGYVETEYHVVQASGGHFLCYDVLRWRLR